MYSCVASHLTHCRNLRKRGIPHYTLKNSTIAWTNEWNSTFHSKDIYKCTAYKLRSEQVCNCMAFHLSHWRNQQFRGIPPFTMKNSRVSWHSTVHNEEIYHWLAFHLTQCRIRQLRGIPHFTMNKRAISWHSTVQAEEIYNDMGFHLNHRINLQLLGIPPYKLKNFTMAWHSTLTTE